MEPSYLCPMHRPKSINDPNLSTWWLLHQDKWKLIARAKQSEQSLEGSQEKDSFGGCEHSQGIEKLLLWSYFRGGQNDHFSWVIAQRLKNKFPRRIAKGCFRQGQRFGSMSDVHCVLYLSQVTYKRTYALTQVRRQTTKVINVFLVQGVVIFCQHWRMRKCRKTFGVVYSEWFGMATTRRNDSRIDDTSSKIDSSWTT